MTPPMDQDIAGIAGKLTEADYESWLQFEFAIRSEAQRLCRQGCDSDCRGCGAGKDAHWRRDAVNSLRQHLTQQEKG